MAEPWYSALLKSVRDQTGIWFIAAVIAILSVFSNRIIESIKFALNGTNLRSGYSEAWGGHGVRLSFKLT